MPATITVTVHNGGTCAAGGFVTQFRTSISSQTGPSESISSLNPGESKTLHLPFVFTSSGNFETVVEVDTGHSVPETNTANNLEILPLTVLPPGINLVLERFTVSPVTPDPTESVVQGRPAIASITVTNTGNFPAGTFVVQWTPYAFAKPLTKTVVGGLAPGASTIVTMEYTFPFAGTVTGTAFADSTNAIKETDKADNKATVKTVVQPPLPNLRVAPEGIQVAPAPAGSLSTMCAEVENDGNNPAGDFVVTWNPGGLVAAQSQQVNGLAEGAVTTVCFNNVYKFAGDYKGSVTVDSTDVVPQVDESDSSTPTDVVVPVATVDLTVTEISIHPTEEPNSRLKSAFKSATLTQGVPNTITVTVQNLGNSPSPSFVTSWNPSAFSIIVPGNQTLTQESAPLGPGATRELTFSFTYPKPGNFRSIAQVNAFNTVNETNTSNNELIDNITVLPAHINLGFTSPIKFTPAHPVVGEKATASFRIRNFGPIASEGFAVQLTPQEGGITQTQFLPGLNVGEEKTLTFPVTYFKKGSYTATAVIDPFNQVVKTVSPDEESQSVTVVPKSAQLSLKLSAVEDIANPHGYQEWVVWLLAYQPGAACTVGIEISTPFSSKEIKKEFKNVTCTNTGGTLREKDFNPGEKRATNATVGLSLQENTPLLAATFAINICQGTCLDIKFPGETTLIEPRTEYLHPFSGEKKEEGKGCEEGKLNGGHCYNAFFQLSLLGHVGQAAVAQEPTAEAKSAISQATTELAQLTASGSGSSKVTITTSTAGP